MVSEYRKEQIRIAVSDARRKMKKKAIEYKGGKCCICGYNKCAAALDFHHPDPNKKDFGIATGDYKSFEKIKGELDKTILVCSNCHREIHDIEHQESFKNRKAELKKIQLPSPTIRLKKLSCDNCGKEINKFESAISPNNFCSRKCKVDFYRNSWPKDNVLSNMFETMSVCDICTQLNKSKTSIYEQRKRLHSRIA